MYTLYVAALNVHTALYYFYIICTSILLRPSLLYHLSLSLPLSIQYLSALHIIYVCPQYTVTLFYSAHAHVRFSDTCGGRALSTHTQQCEIIHVKTRALFSRYQLSFCCEKNMTSNADPRFHVFRIQFLYIQSALSVRYI